MEFTHLLGVDGTALGTDTAPTAATLGNRRFNASHFAGGVLPSGAELFVGAGSVGTTLDFVVWSFNTALGLWFLVPSGGGTVTPQLVVKGVFVKPGAELFLQVTANTGVERIGAGFMGQVENKNR